MPNLKVFVCEVLFQLGGVHSVGERPLAELLPRVGRPAQLGEGRLQAGVLEELKWGIFGLAIFQNLMSDLKVETIMFVRSLRASICNEF